MSVYEDQWLRETRDQKQNQVIFTLKTGQVTEEVMHAFRTRWLKLLKDNQRVAVTLHLEQVNFVAPSLLLKQLSFLQAYSQQTTALVTQAIIYCSALGKKILDWSFEIHKPVTPIQVFTVQK